MAKAKAIDLAAIDTVKGSNEGFDVHIYHPGTLVDLGIVINVLGKDSDEFQRVSRAQSKKRLAKMTKGGFRVQNLTPPPEEIEADGLELLAACTKSWSGVVIEGKEIEFSHENALMVYERFPWIKEQVDTAIGDRANFIKS
ncbi:MAG: hypothetical protein PHY29_11760 [Syntrophales bacterium]|nr:hypothetical protein [Syntrophales bacterium]